MCVFFEGYFQPQILCVWAERCLWTQSKHHSNKGNVSLIGALAHLHSFTNFLGQRRRSVERRNKLNRALGPIVDNEKHQQTLITFLNLSPPFVNSLFKFHMSKYEWVYSYSFYRLIIMRVFMRDSFLWVLRGRSARFSRRAEPKKPFSGCIMREGIHHLGTRVNTELHAGTFGLSECCFNMPITLCSRLQSRNQRAVCAYKSAAVWLSNQLDF